MEGHFLVRWRLQDRRHNRPLLIAFLAFFIIAVAMPFILLAVFLVFLAVFLVPLAMFFILLAMRSCGSGRREQSQRKRCHHEAEFVSCFHMSCSFRFRPESEIVMSL